MFGTVLSRRGLLAGVIIVLGPAIIGGLITIAPTIYQQVTAPRAVLTYARTAGPAISTPSGFVQISTLTIENSGRVPLTSIVVDVGTEHGQIESSAINSPKGVVAKEQSSAKEYVVNVERLLPNDVVRASVMTASNSSDDPLSVAVRSNEVVGTLAPGSDEANRKEGVLKSITFALLGTLFAATGVFFAGLQFRRGRLLDVLAYGSGDVVRYVLVLSRVVPLNFEAFMDDTRLSYIAAGDLFLEAGLRGDDDTKSRCVTGLKALLSARMMEASAMSIRDNLRRLGATLSDADFAKIRDNATGDIAEVRRRAASFFPSV